MNNFDMSSDGVNIEFEVKYDSCLSVMDFNDNFNCIVAESYGTTSLYQYISCMFYEAVTMSDLTSIDRKKTLKKHLLDYALSEDWNSWSKTEIRKMKKDELADLIETSMDETCLSIDEYKEFANEYNLTLVVDDFTFFMSRGYSQGDFAEWCIRDSELADFKSREDELKAHVDNLFWDNRVSYLLTVNGEDYYIDEYVKNLHEYDRDEVYKICESKLFCDHKDKEYILKFIAENTPEYPSESF